MTAIHNLPTLIPRSVDSNSFSKSSTKIANNLGLNTPPCLTPIFVLNTSEYEFNFIVTKIVKYQFNIICFMYLI